MITLASVAFISAGLLLAVYAELFRRVVVRKLKQPPRAFGYGYLCLAAALLVWGIAAVLGNQHWLEGSVMVGNALLLIGSVCMLQVVFRGNQRTSTIAVGAGSLGAIAFLVWRVMFYPPSPELVGGILLFHTATPVAVVLGLVLLLIWLPASLRVAQILTAMPGLRPLRSMYYSVYTMATVAALLFLSAKSPLVVALAFAGIFLSFLMLSGTTMMVDKLGKR